MTRFYMWEVFMKYNQITYQQVKNSEEVNAYIEMGDEGLGVLGLSLIHI